MNKIHKYLKDKKSLIDENEQLQKEVADLRQQLLYNNINELNLMRSRMGAYTNLDVNTEQNYLKKLSIDEIKQFNQWGYELKNSQWFSFLTDWLINKQSALIIGNILDGEKKALFGAGIVDGIIALREEVDARSNAYNMSRGETEDFDENQAIQN
jgi:hypothetical protein